MQRLIPYSQELNCNNYEVQSSGWNSNNIIPKKYGFQNFFRDFKPLKVLGSIFLTNKWHENQL